MGHSSCAALIWAAATAWLALAESETETETPLHVQEGTLHEGRNCYQGNGGGADITGKSPLPEHLDLDECVAACLDEPACEGLVIAHASGQRPCWLRKDLRLDHCNHDVGYDTWVKKEDDDENVKPADFEKHENQNCWYGHGCRGMVGYDPVGGVDNQEACEALCRVLDACQAYVVGQDGTGCWLKTEVDYNGLMDGDGKYNIFVSAAAIVPTPAPALRAGDMISIERVEDGKYGDIVSTVVIGYCHGSYLTSSLAESTDGSSVTVNMFWGHGCKADLSYAWSFTIPAVDGETQFDCQPAEGPGFNDGKCVATVVPETLEISICPKSQLHYMVIWRKVQVGVCVNYAGFSAFATQEEHGVVSVHPSMGPDCVHGFAGFTIPAVDGRTEFPCKTVEGDNAGAQCVAVLGSCPAAATPAPPGPGRTVSICVVEDHSGYYGVYFRKVTEHECETYGGASAMAVPDGDGVEVTTYWGDCSSGYSMGGFYIPAVDGTTTFQCPTVEGGFSGKCVASAEPCQEPTQPPPPPPQSRILISVVGERKIWGGLMWSEVELDKCVEYGGASATAKREGDSVVVETVWGSCSAPVKSTEGSFTIPAVDGQTTFKCPTVESGTTQDDCVAIYYEPSLEFTIAPVGTATQTLVPRVVVGECVDYAGGSSFAVKEADGTITATQYWGSGCPSTGPISLANTFKADGTTQFDCWTPEAGRSGKCVAMPVGGAGGGGDTSGATESETDVSGWAMREGYNCYHGSGAESIEGKDHHGEMGIDECTQLCDSEPTCEGFVMRTGSDNGQCYMRSDISLAECHTGTHYTIHLKPSFGQQVMAKYAQTHPRLAAAGAGSRGALLAAVFGVLALCAVGGAALRNHFVLRGPAAVRGRGGMFGAGESLQLGCQEQVPMMDDMSREVGAESSDDAFPMAGAECI